MRALTSEQHSLQQTAGLWRALENVIHIHVNIRPPQPLAARLRRRRNSTPAVSSRRLENGKKL